MAYFSNGSEGHAFESAYCDHCINNDPEQGCPIMNLHMLWNYEQIGRGKVAKTKEEALNHFIQWDWEDGKSPECKMFRQSAETGEPEFRFHADSELVPLTPHY